MLPYGAKSAEWTLTPSCWLHHAAVWFSVQAGRRSQDLIWVSGGISSGPSIPLVFEDISAIVLIWQNTLVEEMRVGVNPAEFHHHFPSAKATRSCRGSCAYFLWDDESHQENEEINKAGDDSKRRGRINLTSCNCILKKETHQQYFSRMNSVPWKGKTEAKFHLKAECVLGFISIFSEFFTTKTQNIKCKCELT